MKKESRKDPALYAVFAETHDHCQACGIDGSAAFHERWPGLSRHHIVKAGRSDEMTNLLMLCHRCHNLAELLQIREEGVILPTLPLTVCLTIKQTREPFFYEAARLEILRGRALPTPEPIPPFIEAEYRRRRPWATMLFAKGAIYGQQGTSKPLQAPPPDARPGGPPGHRPRRRRSRPHS